MFPDEEMLFNSENFLGFKELENLIENDFEVHYFNLFNKKKINYFDFSVMMIF